jgi:hypothetical protein
MKEPDQPEITDWIRRTMDIPGHEGTFWKDQLAQHRRPILRHPRPCSGESGEEPYDLTNSLGELQ